MSKRIEKTIAFLREQFDNSPYYKTNPEDKEYRYEHSIRTASIAKLIAREEELDEEGLILGCLLHDISYRETFHSKEDHINHGRTSARIARDFLETLDLDKKLLNEICFGIAIHVDGKADFDGGYTPFARSIGDCDNLDRFDVYRLYESLKYACLEVMTLESKLSFVQNRIEHLKKILYIEMGTRTAETMWKEKIEFQITYMNLLLKQLNNSRENSLLIE